MPIPPSPICSPGERFEKAAAISSAVGDEGSTLVKLQSKLQPQIGDIWGTCLVMCCRKSGDHNVGIAQGCSCSCKLSATHAGSVSRILVTKQTIRRLVLINLWNAVQRFKKAVVCGVIVGLGDFANQYRSGALQPVELMIELGR